MPTYVGRAVGVYETAFEALIDAGVTCDRIEATQIVVLLINLRHPTKILIPEIKPSSGRPLNLPISSLEEATTAYP